MLSGATWRVFQYTTETGAKLITPFGFVGRFATKDFRQRLHEYYYSSDLSHGLNHQADQNQRYNNLRLTQFLLDYVLDIGPVALPEETTQEPDETTQEQDSEPSDDDDSTTVRRSEDAGRPLLNASPNPSAIEQYKDGPSFLPEIEISKF